MTRLREVWRGVPGAARACALVALLTALAWAIIIPPYHVPDEPVHAAYAQYLAETGDLPSHEPGAEYSSQQAAALSALDFYGVAGSKQDRPPFSDLQQQRLEDAMDGKPQDDGGNKTAASNQPPLYYIVGAVAYRAAPGTNSLTRLYAMRVVSAVMAAVTVLFVFGFLAELLPGTRLAWTVGALAVALQPMFGFMSGGVNNDNLLYLASAALFYALARAFRRGLTRGTGAAMGGALAVGCLGKLTMIAFAPAAAATVLWLLWRAGSPERREAFRGAGVAAAVFAAPIVLYVLLNATLWDRPFLQNAAGVSAPSTDTAGVRPSILREQLSYIWQLFLPRLPFMSDPFPLVSPIWDTWFTGFNGRFGWLDYDFGQPAYKWMWRLVYLPLIVLAVVGVARSRRSVLRRLPEFLVYVLAVGGLMIVIGRPSYTHWLSNQMFPFYQPRYILPLLPLFAALVALAVRGAGRRAGPIVAAVVVMLALAHTLFAQLITLTRYYG